MVRMVKLVIVCPVVKTKEQRNRFRNPPYAAKNNHVSMQTITVPYSEFTLLYQSRHNKENETWNRLIEQLKDDGMRGPLQVRLAAGGPGRVWPWQTAAQRKKARPVRGFPLLRRLDLV